ncbi:MAG: DUF3592 domain-containing protein [Wenzhouxiangella sp.]|nr:DUF3592 domain-containing protein [Wenzhouxiangella sp.]
MLGILGVLIAAPWLERFEGWPDRWVSSILTPEFDDHYGEIPQMLNAFLLVFGATMLWAGWQTVKEQRRLMKKGVETEARVVEVKEFQREGRLNYMPIWAFKDEAGIEYRLPRVGWSEGSTNRSRFKIGDTKRIVYDPDSPDKVHGVGARQYSGIVIYLVVSLGLIGYVLADMIGLMG